MSPRDAFFIRALRLVRFTAYIVVVVGITAASVGYQVADQQEAHATRMKAWQQADGNVVRADVEEVQKGDSAEALYCPGVLVEYTVGENQFSTDRVFGSDQSELESRHRADVEDVLKPFTSAATVPVWFDPQNPSKAVLSRDVFPGFDEFKRVRLNPTGVLIAGIGLAIAGLVLVRLVSSIVSLVMRKYEAFVGDPSRLTTSALQEFYPGLESARFFQTR